MSDFSVIKILILSIISFLAAFFWTPFLTSFLYKYKLGKQIRNSKDAPIFYELHKEKGGTPTMGGLLIWVTTLVLALLFFYLGKLFPGGVFEKLNFLNRSQTLLPLGVLVASAIVGLVDDYLDIRRMGSKGRGLGMGYRLIIYTLIAIFGAWWFSVKLQWDIIHIPFLGNYTIGWWYIPIFIFVIISTAFSVNETDGLDGLAGGTLLFGFFAFGVIAFFLGRIDLAALCGVIIGSLSAFLWFNIYPARFFMGDTGAMSLGVTLGVIAMLTNYVFLLPIISLIFIIESLSVIIQVTSKKLRKKKIFISTPIHHHLQAKGWPEPKIVMRFWVISWLTAAAGLILFLLDKQL